MTKQERSYDVVVIGGGPAGSSTATLLAQQGRKVLLLEKERFPRFRIGESLMPATYWTLKRLGVLEKMSASRFPRKHSVQFFLRDGSPTRPFYFSDIDPHEWSVTWQVDRGTFDELLLDHAAAQGVEVHRESPVQEVLFEEGRAIGVAADLAGKGRAEIGAKVVVDATGQSGLLSRALGLKDLDPKLKNAAVFSRFRGALRDPGRDGGATLVLHTDGKDAWFWYIPLPDDEVSVGVVGPIRYLIKGRAGDPQRILDEEIARCPALQPRIKNSQQAEWVRVLRDFSYMSHKIAGDGWLLVGDAFGFLDPIYSSGVLLALQGAEFAADTIGEALTAGDLSGERLGRHGPRFVEGMEAIRHLVYAFYAREFHFKNFLDRFPEHRDDLTRVLTGDVFKFDTRPLYGAMDQMLHLDGYQPLRLKGAAS